MPREFPTSLEILRQLTEFPTDTVTERGRKGFIDMCQYIRDLVEDWGLGEVTIQKFAPTDPSGDLKPELRNLFIDVNVQEGREMMLWHGHGDTVCPDEIKEYASSGRTPTHLMRCPGEENVYMVCGGIDMKVGITAYVSALLRLVEILERVNRSIRVAIVTHEEQQSEGTYVGKPFLQVAQEGISMETAVGRTLADPPAIYHGRPGRAVYDVHIQGLESMHIGAVDPSNPRLLIPRLEHALKTIRQIQLSRHPNHPHDIVPQSICYPGKVTTEAMSSMTAENDARFKVEVIYTNPDLELAVIEDIIRRALQAVLTEDFSVELVKGRQTPWIRPWFEEPNHPLVQAAVHEAGEVVQHPVERRYARGVADENIIAHMGVPMVLFPPRGQDEHNVNERVDVSYVDRVMVPFLHRMAGTEWKLRW